MKVIVTYRKFHNIDRDEIMPEVFYVREDETPEDALRRIWNDIIKEHLIEDNDDPLDEKGCWIEEDMAQIAWADGDTKEFYVVEVEEYR